MSGLSRTPGKRVWVNSPPRVRIPPSPPRIGFMGSHKDSSDHVKPCSTGLFRFRPPHAAPPVARTGAESIASIASKSGCRSAPIPESCWPSSAWPVMPRDSSCHGASTRPKPRSTPSGPTGCGCGCGCGCATTLRQSGKLVRALTWSAHRTPRDLCAAPPARPSRRGVQQPATHVEAHSANGQACSLGEVGKPHTRLPLLAMRLTSQH